VHYYVHSAARNEQLDHLDVPSTTRHISHIPSEVGPAAKKKVACFNRTLRCCKLQRASTLATDVDVDLLAYE
jgi:hypothetical protein